PLPQPARHSAPPPPPPLPPTQGKPGRWDVALGIGGDLTGGRFTVAVPATLGYQLGDAGFGVRAMAITTPSRQDPLGPGQVSWRRWPLGVGPSFSAGSPSLAWELNPGVALGWLHVAGKKFDHTFRHDAATWGGYLNARVSSRGPHWGAFGLANAQFYPVKADVYVTGIGDSWPVPRLTLALAVGVDFSP
ncbi:MAG TPA: hypothetical protein VNG33_07060, partial [Polyangiaceae bacterium]|nr:hypothetical protein [Polyangiaceae bacterium]